MKKPKILITGSSGFIGSHLQNFLDEYELHGCDVKQKQNIFDLPDVYGFDAVIHLAALIDVRESFTDAQRYFWTNAMGTAHMVELCTKAKVKLIYASSAAVCFPSSSPYAYSKWIGEKLVEGMNSAVGGVILRFENIYGQGMGEGTLFSRFLHNDSLTVYGNGEHTRDFINVADVCMIIHYALQNKWENVKLDIGTGKGTSVNEIAKLFAKETNKPIIMMPKVGEVQDSKANIRKLKELYPFPLITNLKKDIASLIKENN